MIKILKKIIFHLSVISLILFSGCSQPSSYYNGEKGYIQLSNQNQLTLNTLTIDAKKILISSGEYELFQQNPALAIKHSINKIIPGMYGSLIKNTCYKPYKVIAELCIYAANHSNKEDTIKYWMTACVYSYKYLFDGNSNHILPLSPESAYVINYYNFSLIKIFTYIQNHNYIDRSKFTIPSLIGKVNFSYPFSDLPWKIHSFKNFIIGYNYKPKYFNETTFQIGVGIPLGGIPFSDDKFQEILTRVKILKYMYPCTFMLRFDFHDNKRITAKPYYIDFYKNTYIKINSQQIVTPNAFTSLAGNFLDEYPQKMTTNYFFSPQKLLKDKMGIYMLTEYDKNKIPVVFIHGLISTPQSFYQIVNTLMQSEAIRENYQFWFLYYPTGQPIILDAYDLRTILNNMQKHFNPDLHNSKFNDMFLVGYSQGGLIAQLCIQSSNDNYFKQQVLENNKNNKNTAENLKVINKLDKVLRFEPLPYVKDVVFISTPHKGAEMASWLVFQLIADFLTTTPENYNRNLRFISELPTKYNDQIVSDNALYNLMPNSSFINLVQKLPYNKNVNVYSIISDKNGPNNPAGTDGIITYKSAHLKNATKEVIIKSDHHPILHSECAKEVLKILLTNLSEKQNY